MRACASRYASAPSSRRAIRSRASANRRWSRASSRTSSSARPAPACADSAAVSVQSATVSCSLAVLRATAAAPSTASASPGSPGSRSGSSMASPAACCIRCASASSAASPSRTWASVARRRSARRFSTSAKRRVSKRRPSSLPRASASARRNRAKSPCGRSTTWQNCSRLMPSSWVTSSPISWWERLRSFQAAAVASYSRSQVWALSSVVPVPRFLGRSQGGWRVTSNRRPATVSSRVTSVRVAGAAWSLRRVAPCPPPCRAPGTEPYRA